MRGISMNYLATNCPVKFFNGQMKFDLYTFFSFTVLYLFEWSHFSAFFASSLCTASAISSDFFNLRPVQSRSFSRFGSNPALKPNRIL